MTGDGSTPKTLAAESRRQWHPKSAADLLRGLVRLWHPAGSPKIIPTEWSLDGEVGCERFKVLLGASLFGAGGGELFPLLLELILRRSELLQIALA